MASSRKSTAGKETVSSYGTGKDYTSLSTWETANYDCTGNSTCYVLEVYGDSHNDSVSLSGGNTDATYFRVIRPATGNFLNTGAISTRHFNKTSDVSSVFLISEENDEIQDMVAYNSGANSASSRVIFTAFDDNSGFVGCVAKSYNAGSGAGNGFSLSGGGTTDSIAYTKNCIAFECKTNGFSLYTSLSSTDAIAYNCTSVYNGGDGFIGRSTSISYCYGCGSTGNSGDQFDATVATTDCNNSEPTFVDAANDNYHLASGDTTWKDADTNSGSWHSSCGYDDDIDKNTRTGTWDIGADEYVSTTSIKTILGLAKASVKTVNGLAIASVKTWEGLS